jgi:hypothetical protein
MILFASADHFGVPASIWDEGEVRASEVCVYFSQQFYAMDPQGSGSKHPSSEFLRLSDDHRYS